MLRIAEREWLDLHQSFRKLMARAFRKHCGNAKAKQFKRALSALKSLKTMAGVVFRAVERKLSDSTYGEHRGTMILSELILAQKRTTKGKIYSLHSPEVECIAKGKVHRPHAVGVKVAWP